MSDSPTLGLKRKACFLQLPGTARSPFLFPLLDLLRNNLKTLAGKTVRADLAYGQKNVRVNIPVVPMLRSLVHIRVSYPARASGDLPAKVSEHIFALLLRKLPRKVDDDLLGLASIFPFFSGHLCIPHLAALFGPFRRIKLGVQKDAGEQNVIFAVTVLCRFAVIPRELVLALIV